MRLRAARSGAQNRSGSESGLSAELRGAELLAILEPRREHFDLPPLRTHEEAPITHGGDRADASLHVAEGTRRVLARLEHAQLLAVPERPRRRRSG